MLARRILSAALLALMSISPQTAYTAENDGIVRIRAVMDWAKGIVEVTLAPLPYPTVSS